MRRGILIAFCLPLLLAGCGNRNLILTVDILSFMDPAAKTVNYSIPVAVPSDTVEVFSDSLNLLQGVGDVTRAVAASLDLAASFDNTSGAATGDLLIYIASADSTSPFTTTPFADVPFQLLPGQVTNVNTHVDASAALADALTHDRAIVGVRVVFNGTSFPIAGTETLTQLLATVIMKKDL